MTITNGRERASCRVVAVPTQQVVYEGCPPDCPWLGYRSRSINAGDPLPITEAVPFPGYTQSHTWRERLNIATEAYKPIDVIRGVIGRLGVSVPRTEIFHIFGGRSGTGYCSKYPIRAGCLFKIRLQR